MEYIQEAKQRLQDYTNPQASKEYNPIRLTANKFRDKLCNMCSEFKRTEKESIIKKYCNIDVPMIVPEAYTLKKTDTQI